VENREAWTYADLDLRSEQVAVALVDAGASGHVVAVHAGRGAGLVCGLVGVLKAGSAFLVLDPSYPPGRLAEQVRLAAPRAWISAGAEPSPQLAAALAGARRIEADGGPGGARVLVEPDLDRLAYIAFTSGTTGRPKGVLGCERPLAHFLGWHAARFQLGSDDRFAMLSGLAYDPLLRDVFTPLWVGARLCIPSPETLLDPDRLARWLADRLVTVVHVTPALLRLLAANGATLPSLNHVFVGGDVLIRADAARLHRVAPNASLVNFYGTTETPQAVAYHELGDAAALRDRVPIGSGIEGVQLLLLNSQGGQAGVGELAELHVRSHYLAQGYLDDRALTRAQFLPNPFAKTGDRLYRTGDLGRYLPDGEVELVGRADDQVKVRGFRVELGEVAACLRRLDGVLDAAALAPSDGHAERRVVAYIVSRAPLAPTLSEIRRGLQAWLPEYMLPSALVVLDSLPRLPSGKLDRSRMPEPETLRPELGPGYVMPGTPGERIIAQVWSDVLGIEHVGTRDNFFDLGGNSLAIAEVHSRLQGLGAKVSVVDLFRYPDIQSLAQQLDSTAQAKGSSTRVEARRAAMARRNQTRPATAAGKPRT
jgi:amino acid adenylation domain-containing protein